MANPKRGESDDRLTQLNKCLQAFAETEAYLNKCAECHLNVDKERRQNAEQLQIARDIKRVFYPNVK